MKRCRLAASFLLTFIPLALGFVGQAHSSQQETVALKEVTPFVYCCLPASGPYTEIPNVIGRLMQNMQGQNIFPRGPMLGIYYSSPAEVKPEELTWELGFPVTEQATVQSPLVKKSWEHKTVAVALHVGPYEKAVETISKMLDWIGKNGCVVSGPLMERYLDMDPSRVKPEELKTEIWIPCQKTK